MNIDESLIKGINSLLGEKRQEQRIKTQSMFSRKKSIEEMILDEATLNNELLKDLLKKDDEDKKKIKTNTPFKLSNSFLKGAGVLALAGATAEASKKILELGVTIKDLFDSTRNRTKLINDMLKSQEDSYHNTLNKKTAQGLLNTKEQKELEKTNKNFDAISSEAYKPSFFGFFGDHTKSKTARKIGLFKKNDPDGLKLLIFEKYRMLFAHNKGRANTGQVPLSQEEMVKKARKQAVIQYYDAVKKYVSKINPQLNKIPDEFLTIGKVSAQQENPSGNPRTISSGVGDAGGASFGDYQLASNLKVPERFVSGYLSQQYPELSNKFKGLKSTDDKFKNLWVQAVDVIGIKKFKVIEKKFIYDTHYKPAYDLIKQRLKLDVNKYPSLKELLWAVSVQHGGTPKRTINVLNIFKRAIGRNDVDKLTPQNIINKVENERFKKNNEGKFAYFTGSNVNLTPRKDRETKALLSIANNNEKVRIKQEEIGKANVKKLESANKNTPSSPIEKSNSTKIDSTLGALKDSVVTLNNNLSEDMLYKQLSKALSKYKPQAPLITTGNAKE